MRFFLAAIISIGIIFSGCTTTTSEGDSNTLVKDIANSEEFCTKNSMQGNTDPYCHMAVAYFNNDPTECSKGTLREGDEKYLARCSSTLKDGKFAIREYKTGTSCSFDGKEFGDLCQKECDSMGMKVKVPQTIEDKTSLNSYSNCGPDGAISVSACYCFKE